MGFLQSIGEAIAETLKPVLVQKADQLIGEVAETIAAEIQKHLPVIIEAVIKAVTSTSVTLAQHEAGKITDLIPGTVDDKFVNDIFTQIKNSLGL